MNDEHLDQLFDAEGFFGHQKVKLVVVNHRLKGNQALLAFAADKVEFAATVDKEFNVKVDVVDESIEVKVKEGSDDGATFTMRAGEGAQNFVAELFRLQEENKKKSTSEMNNDFSWMPAKGQSCTDNRSKSRKEIIPDLSEDMTSKVNIDPDESPESSLNRHDIALGEIQPLEARESAIRHQMSLKESFFTRIQNFTIFIGTWNVNGQSPNGHVRDWLAADKDPPDVYVVGFQELDLSKEAFVFNESPKEDEWLQTVMASLHSGAKYEKVKLVRLVGMMLIVLVKKDHVKFVTDVAAEVVGTGIMGKLGNKGGVAVRMDLHNTRVCLVNSHLAAHVSECERRNQDYLDICSRLQFAQFNPPRAIKDHDMVYWLGDLNYRITDFDANEVKDLLQKNDLESLLNKDQFLEQRRMRKVFGGYEEGPITFVPTYKFDPGTDRWDSSEKGRAPAWTDRVLWKGDHVKQTAYRSHMALQVSDHKPVSAVFEAGMKVVDPVQYRRIYEDVMKRLDRLENEFLPQVTVDTTEIDFKTVKFLEPVTSTLTVANTGQVPVTFEFIKKLNDTSFCKPWLKVDPSKGSIMPGEKSDVSLEIYVDKHTAGALTAGQEQMYDILVLHLVGGKDIFVTVSGSYSKSSFGASIDALCKLTVPISEVSPGKLLELEKGDKIEGEKDDEMYPVPKELWFLCDLITSLGLTAESMFLQSGLRAEVIAIRNWLDTGLPVDIKSKVSIHSAAECLLLFLESLREPIIPFSAYGRCLDAASNYLQAKQMVSCLLPERHKNVFNYMTAFLREVMRHAAQNKLDPNILATLFSGIFLRDPPGTSFGSGIRAKSQQHLLEQKKARFVYHFIVNDPDQD